MKKKYLLFILCLFMFFCANIDGVKAANRQCSSDVNIKKAYSCDYRGYNHDRIGLPKAVCATWGGSFCVSIIDQEYTSEFTLLMVEDVNGNYCSAVYNPSLVYNDNYHINVVGDSSFSIGNSKIRRAVQFDLNYDNVFNKMESGSCPNMSLTFDVAWNLDGSFWFLESYGIKDSPFSNPVQFVDMISSDGRINDITGNNLQILDKDSATNYVKFSNPTEDEVLEQIKNAANKNEILKIYSNDSDASCDGILGNEVSTFLKKLFFVLCVIGIIICVVLTIIDFIGFISSDDDDGLSKKFKKLKNRIILVIVLLLLPTLINWFIDFANKHLYYGADGKITFGNISDCFASNSTESVQNDLDTDAARQEKFNS